MVAEQYLKLLERFTAVEKELDQHAVEAICGQGCTYFPSKIWVIFSFRNFSSVWRCQLGGAVLQNVSWFLLETYELHILTIYRLVVAN